MKPRKKQLRRKDGMSKKVKKRGEREKESEGEGEKERKRYSFQEPGEKRSEPRL